MKIDSPHFGSMDVAPEKVIEFPLGLPGFEAARRFTLFHPESDAAKYMILQSLDDVDLAFHISDPALFGFDYEIELSDEEEKSIELSNAADAAVVVILMKDAVGGIRANFSAPLVINLASRKGIQHVFSSLSYRVTLRSPEA